MVAQLIDRSREQGFRLDDRNFVLGDTPSFRKVYDDLVVVLGHDVTVLIEGETGTGKELFARTLHQAGARRSKPFVALNCAALPSSLVESELFGTQRGAFTDAKEARRGLIAEADTGTLFLDEVASLDLTVQAKLLRFLQEGEYRPVGGRETRKSDVRILAASNKQLAEAVEEGTFRSDLYYRLAVYPLVVPPLRERSGDIPKLVQHFVDKYARRFDVLPPRFEDGALRAMQAYSWPGNVRELENIVQRLVLKHVDSAVDAEALPPEILADSQVPLATGTEDARAIGGGRTFQEQKAAVIEQFERDYLHQLMVEHQGNVSRAARAAGKHRRALTALLAKHRIDRRSFVSRTRTPLRSADAC